jgi:hypothetical protein
MFTLHERRQRKKKIELKLSFVLQSMIESHEVLVVLRQFLKNKEIYYSDLASDNRKKFTGLHKKGSAQMYM